MSFRDGSERPNHSWSVVLRYALAVQTGVLPVISSCQSFASEAGDSL